MEQVRIGVIGAAGNMASHHCKYINELDGGVLAAVCERDPEKLGRVAEAYPDAKAFADGDEMIDSGQVDAILIATPHYDHPPYAQHAFKAGVHVLTEKPVAVTAKAAQQSNDAYAAALKQHPKLIYAGMFNQRTRPQWRQIKKMCDDGTLGELIRVEWVITSWFRSQAYYDSGGWRATWSGEGGGVLINQCPHNLDLFQWFVGMPEKLWAIAGIGKYHHIEVEDDITAMMSFKNGATGTFITSTGQTPGINRLTIVGENGTLETAEGGEIRFREASQNIRTFCRTTPERFGNVAVTEHVIKPYKQPAPEHRTITQNFVNVILGKEDELIAPAVEGIHGLELGNAMLLSGLRDGAPVNLPTDRDGFDRVIKDLAKNSTFEKRVVESKEPAAMTGSF